MEKHPLLTGRTSKKGLPFLLNLRNFLEEKDHSKKVY
jgi:hypothetical protein